MSIEGFSLIFLYTKVFFKNFRNLGLLFSGTGLLELVKGDVCILCAHGAVFYLCILIFYFFLLPGECSIC